MQCVKLVGITQGLQADPSSLAVEAKLVPRLYQVPGVPAGHTTYQMIVGDETVWDEPFVVQRGIGAVPNSTPVVVQTHPSKSVSWTKPQDVTYQPGQLPVNVLGPPMFSVPGYPNGKTGGWVWLDSRTGSHVLPVTASAEDWASLVQPDKPLTNSRLTLPMYEVIPLIRSTANSAIGITPAPNSVFP